MIKPQKTDSYIRYLSRRGTYDTITFSDVDCMPSIFDDSNSRSSLVSNNRNNNIQNKCEIPNNVSTIYKNYSMLYFYEFYL